MLIGEVPHGKSYGPFFESFESGMMSSNRFFFEVTRLFNCAELIDYEPFATWWSSIFISENTELDQLLTRIPLRKFLLSNTNRMIFNRYIAHTMIVQNHFREWEQRILSYIIGAVKPDPPIYQEALRRSGVHPSQCLFIDDVHANISAWQALGGHGVVYDARHDSIEALEQKLLALGVTIS
ncbi:MAG: HAD-superfamily hydrolase, subfamily IA, variant 3 [Parcubacteria group bacterium GW2011_GWA2_47_8]|nr:MAG: HAD-superfamily hydrolase, subfamily IA, variant 3 [Parcubacteria group bacterium GW2011_GWA2_47_8]